MTMSFVEYLYVFLVGGLICLIGQILVIKTKMTTARILVLFEIIGVVLQAFNVFEPISDFANAGINVPIIGFGAALARGAMQAVNEKGLLGAFTGGLSATAGGIATAIFFAFLFSLIFKSKTKNKK